MFKMNVENVNETDDRERGAIIARRLSRQTVGNAYHNSLIKSENDIDSLLTSLSNKQTFPMNSIID
jgi:hypothetical protein